MKTYSRQAISLALVLLALLSGIVSWGCAGSEADVAPSAALIRPAKIMVVGAAEAGSARIYPGKTRASQTVSLAFRVGGPLIEVAVNAGQVVDEGQVLARIDPRDYELRVRTYEADLAAAEALAVATRLELQRARGLFEHDSASKSDFDRMRAANDIAVAQVEVISQSLEAARLALKDSVLRSPFRGIVASRLVENHDIVGAGQPVFRLQDSRRLEIVIDVPEGEIAGMTGKALPLRVSFDATEGCFDARVKEYVTEADASTQTYSVVLELTVAADADLLPGMTATVTSYPRIELDGGRVYIPMAALGVDEARQVFVWVVDPQTMTLSKRAVMTGELADGGVEVHEGLSVGEQILAAGVGIAVDGQRVRPFHARES